MSTTADAQREIMLNGQQVEAIIAYARNNNMYDGEPPTDPEMRRTDAATLVYQARRARDNGNTSPNVTEICFIADADQNPSVPPQQPQQSNLVDPAAAFAPPAPEGGGASPAPPQAPPPPEPPPAKGNGGPDLTKESDESLANIIEALQPNAQIPAIAVEIEKVKAEQQRRQQGAAQPAQTQDTPPAAPPAPAAAPPQSPAPPPAVSDPGATQGAVAPPPGPALPPGGTDVAGQPRPAAADAGSPSEVPATEPYGEGSVPPAQAPSEVERRTSLERQLTGQILIAYGKTFADVASISTQDLERMIAYPGGPSSAAPPAPVETAPSVSSERLALEEQVGGPMLKAWGRGRANIPQLSDDELREMIQYPGGPTTRPQGQQLSEGQAGTNVSSQATTVPPAGQQPEAATPPQQEPPPAAPAPQAQPSLIAPPVSGHTPDPQRRETAEEIIARERLPIPPEVEAPPELAFDISKLSDEQLRSTHGQFHAVETRVNWVIALRDDELDRLKEHRALRETEIRNEPREGKRLTKDEMTAIIDADSLIHNIDTQIREVERGMNKLKTIRENATRTCMRCSREWSMRHREEDDTPRRGS